MIADLLKAHPDLSLSFLHRNLSLIEKYLLNNIFNIQPMHTRHRLYLRKYHCNPSVLKDCKTFLLYSKLEKDHKQDEFIANRPSNKYISGNEKKFFSLKFLYFCLLTLAASVIFLHACNEKKWENQTRTSELYAHSGVPNPYRTDEFLYMYGTYDSIGKRRNSQRCIFYMYSLLSNQDTDTESTLEYLRQFDQKDLKKIRRNNPSILFSADNRMIKSTWISSKNLKTEMFESFDGAYEVPAGYTVPNPKELKHYEIFNNCRSLGLDKKPMDKKQHYNRTGFVFFEEFKSRRTKRRYNQDTLIKIIQDPETLLKFCVFRKGTRKGGVISNFYSTKYNAYVLMDASNGMVPPYKWIHPRCY